MLKYLLFLLLLPCTLTAQQVIFCEQVDASGRPKNASNEFTIGNEGGFFKILVKLNEQVSSNEVVFDVYKVAEGTKHFDTSLRMEVKPAITWFFKEITFFKPGEYQVYVYSDKDKLLGVGHVVIHLK